MRRRQFCRTMTAFILVLLVTFLLLVGLGGRCARPPVVPTRTPVATTELVTPPPSPTNTPTRYPTLTHTPTPTATAEPTDAPKPTHTATPGPEWLEISVPYDMSVWFRSCPSRECVSIYPLNTIRSGERVIFRQCANPAGFVWVEIWYGAPGYVYSDYVRPDVCRIR